MILYPAIDLKDKKCVRLFKGKLNNLTIFNENPVEQALAFEQNGCEWIHLVDLDSAIEGKTSNTDLIKDLIKAVNIPVQIGGGIRELNQIEKWIKNGVSRVILGTTAIQNQILVKEAAREFFGKVAVAIDARNGFVAINGWENTTSVRAIELAKQLEGFGVSAVIYTDINRDGAMSGPNIKMTERIANAINLPVIASGGVSSIKDLIALRDCSEKLNGVITGRAIYENAINIKRAISCLRK